MAYAALVSISQLLEQILHYDECLIILHGPTQPIKSFLEKTTALQSHFEEFPQNLINLEGRIRDAAYEAEDIIENFSLSEIDLFPSSEPTTGTQKVMLACYQDVKLHNFRKFLRNLHKVTLEFDCILQEARETITINHRCSKETQPKPGESSSLLGSSSLGQLHLDEDVMVGFDDEAMASIKDRLCGQSLKLQTIPIVGMGGIGKTTLARNLYNDQLIVEHFHIRAWAAISQEYSVQEVLQRLLSIEGHAAKDDIGSLLECLYKRLKGNMYLIVLDDMWDAGVWDEVKCAFPDDNNGSRVVLTTRVAEVAAYVDCFAPLHEMHLLDGDQSWDLLQKKLFAKNSSCPPELGKTGRTISRKCRGLPLAIVTIAGLLSTEMTLEHWNNVAENVILLATSNDEKFSKLLSLSYNHLPHHLKSCFLCMGEFPEDYKIRVSRLVKLWVAEGFSRPSDESNKSPEELAEEYLEDLVKRNLVLVISRSSNGKIKYCGIHDILRELCIEKANEEGFFKNVAIRSTKSMKGVVDNQRRISIHSDAGWDLSIDPNALGEFANTLCSSRVRTALFFRGHEGLLIFLRTFKLLRVLELRIMALSEFPVEICELFFLRYIALFCTFKNRPAYLGSHKVPASISNLWNLETLIVHAWGGNTNIDLPSDIWRLPRLRHIAFYAVSLPRLLERPSFTLQNLQTLSRVKGFQCSIEILNMLPNLKKLGIIYPQDSFRQNPGWFQLQNLFSFCRLEKLYFCLINLGGHYNAYGNQCYSWYKLAFPTTLRKLTLEGPLKFPWMDMELIVGSLPRLEVLKLRDDAFSGPVWRTREGDYFPRLKVLLMKKINLRHWITEKSHFPKLERLGLHKCYLLEEIPEGIAEIPTLQLIEVEHCSKSLEASARQIQEEVLDMGNDYPQFRIKS